MIFSNDLNKLVYSRLCLQETSLEILKCNHAHVDYKMTKMI